MPTYEDVLTLAQQLNAVEQTRLAEALMLLHQTTQTENHLEPSSQTLILNSLKARLQTIPPGVSLVDELIAERREAATKEEQA
ncbi:MAG: hypothetical protein KME11_08005 [Timaviella obliquedivisa GSE-PSE-MK23-08B]|jgi:hypothetical protein|nr:hypothetical protein [Timaviella obliquedivisa GSE-PSE-MK23-08B]